MGKVAGIYEQQNVRYGITLWRVVVKITMRIKFELFETFMVRILNVQPFLPSYLQPWHASSDQELSDLSLRTKAHHLCENLPTRAEK